MVLVLLYKHSSNRFLRLSFRVFKVIRTVQNNAANIYIFLELRTFLSKKK